MRMPPAIAIRSVHPLSTSVIVYPAEAYALAGMLKHKSLAKDLVCANKTAIACRISHFSIPVPWSLVVA